jgi:hypothetical protein
LKSTSCLKLEAAYARFGRTQQLFSEIASGWRRRIVVFGLVFNREQPMVGSMNLLSFCRRLLSHSSVSGGETTQVRADQGDANSQFALGLKCGSGDTQDALQAAEWYRKAAEQGHAPAQYSLGLMYANGHGVPRDDAQALIWIRKAAEGGDPGGQHHLGGRCHRASLRERQVDASECRIEAYKWLFLALGQGYKGSAAACEQLTLGMTNEELAEGNQRAASFVVRRAGSRKDR